MDTTVIKKIKFAKNINIIFAITSIFYVILALIYFVAMGNTMLYGGEYDQLGVVFGFIFLPVILALFLIPVFRIIIAVCSVKLNKAITTGGRTSKLRTSTGVMQIIDAIISFFIFTTIGSITTLFSQDLLQSVFGTGQLFSLMYLFLGFIFFILAAVKSVLQFVSAIQLFKIRMY